MKNDLRKGQAMLLASLALGGAILGATTIAGLLMLYQLRSSTDSENSARAIFAADTGVEWALFSNYCNQAVPSRCGSGAPAQPGTPAGTLSNGAVMSVTCYDGSGDTTDCHTAAAVETISKGTSLNSKRAFFADLSSATATYP